MFVKRISLLIALTVVATLGISGCSNITSENTESGSVTVDIKRYEISSGIDIDTALTISSILEEMGYSPVLSADYSGTMSNMLVEGYKEKSTTASCTTDNFPSIYFQDLEVEIEGRLFNREDLQSEARVTVIGKGFARMLFSTTDGIFGKYLGIGGTQFEIIGVYDARGKDLSESSSNTESSEVRIPLTTAISSLGVDEVYDISLWLNDVESLSNEAKRICKELSEAGIDTVVQYYDDQGRQLGTIENEH